MKSFIIKVLFFAIPIVLAAYTRSFYLYYTEKYKETVAGNDIYHAIFKSKQKKVTKKVLLGDSVGRQLFNNKEFNDSIYSLACNQAVGLPGHYFLLNNFINTGNKPDVVYLVFSPFSFKNNLDQVYTYHYFLKPFNTKEYDHLFTETVHKQIEKIPYRFLSHELNVLTTNWAPNYHPKHSEEYTFFSPISIEYLNKIKQLSLENDFQLIILPTPTSIEKKKDLDKMNKLEFMNSMVSDEFESYFKNIIFISDSNFVDGIHLIEPKVYTDYYIKTWLN